MLRPLLLIPFFLSLCFAAGIAQTGGDTITFYVRMPSIESHKNGVATVRVPLPGSLRLLAADAAGKVYGVGSDETADRNLTILGNATVAKVERQMANNTVNNTVNSTATITIAQTPGSDTVQPGDAIELRGVIDSAIFRGDLFHSARFDIRFLAMDGTPLAEQSATLRATDAALEDSVVAAIANQVHLGAERLLASTPLDSALLAPLEGGLFDGVNILTAMGRATQRDARSFLRHVSNAPSAYFARDVVAASGWLLWAANGAPLLTSDLRERLLSAPSDSARAVLIDGYRTMLTNDLLLQWDSDAEDLFLQQRARDAEQMERAMLQAARQQRDTLAMAWGEYRLGRFLVQGAPSVAATRYRTAQLLFANLNHQEGEAWARLGLGWVALLEGKPKDAEKEYNEAVTLFQSIGQKSYEAYALNSMGDAVSQQGDYSRALALYQRGLAAAQLANDPEKSAGAWSAISLMYRLMGELQKGLAAAQSGFAVWQSANNPWGMGQAYTMLANVYTAQGEFQKALQHYTSADSIYRQLRDTNSRITTLNNSGNVYFFQGDYDHALANFREALVIARAANARDESEPLLLSNMGEVLYEQHRFDTAEQCLKEALALARQRQIRRMIASTHRLLGKLWLMQERYPQAEEALLLADSLFTAGKEADDLMDVRGALGELYYRRSNPDKARPILQKAIDSARAMGLYHFLYQPLTTLGLLERDAHNNQRAIELLSEAAAVVERLRDRVAGGDKARKLYSSGTARVRIYESLIALLIEQGEIERALEYLQRSNNDELRERFGALERNIGDTTRRKILDQDRQMKARLDNLADQIAKEQASPNAQPEKIASLRNIISVAEGEYVKFVRQTITEQPELRSHFGGTVNPIDLRAKKQRIPRDAAVAIYLLGETQLYIFAATTDTVIARVVPAARSEVEAKINRLYRLASDPDAAAARAKAARVGGAGSGAANGASGTSAPDRDQRTYGRIADELYQLLIAPIADQLAGKSKLAITPSGPLYFVPFQAIGPMGDDGAVNPLLRQRTVFYINDLSVFLQDAPTTENLKIIGFGNADGSLPSAEQEVKVITKEYPGSEALLGGAATEDRAKHIPEGFNIIHFATHGNLDYHDFKNFYLTLAPNKPAGEDGKLTMEEIWGITTLPECRLVTLSACNTAVTDQSLAGWPMNPANAFLTIGVPRVVASLWQVDDEATAILMEDFYKHLPQLGAAESLRQAQMRLANTPQWSQPFYWAPFVLFGDWR
ncbi:MAG: CHAT domain-containing protein [Chlorobi bacterium]|nr:MAG: Two-component system-sensor histidine kinase [Chlorobi bacterium OLB7]MBK8910441.1 CHAT domain-containing protein [Chlorobiota bacterium]MBX7216986.1 CHAT domain-containing protein [Candidatus Kapabacteria bacterium]